VSVELIILNAVIFIVMVIILLLVCLIIINFLYVNTSMRIEFIEEILSKNLIFFSLTIVYSYL
jgi:hypothetical protein